MEPDDLEELRKRVAALEAILEAIFDLDLPWSQVDGNFTQRRKSRKDRLEPPSPGQMRYLIDRYYHRRETAFLPTIDRVEELSSAQSSMAVELRELVKAMTDQFENTKRDIISLEARSRLGAAELHQWLAIQTLGLVEKETRITRFLPMRAYLSDMPENGVNGLTDAINNLIETFGFEVSDEFPEILGSWFKKWFVRTKEVASQPEVADRLAKIERALEIKGLGTPQAEIDSKQAGAIAALTTALASTPSAVIQVGSILFLKLTIDGQAVVQARGLTQRELIILENNQDLLNSPATIMTKLAGLCPTQVNSLYADVGSALSPSVLEIPDIWNGLQTNGSKKRDPVDLPAVPRLPFSGEQPRDLNDEDRPD